MPAIVNIKSKKENCPFCQIGSGKLTTDWLVHEDERTIAFFPDEPAALGHTLIIPKEHVESIWNIRDEDAYGLIDCIRLISSSLHESFEPDGINVIQSNGKAAEQSIPHVHFHVVPRVPNDEIGPIWHHSPSLSVATKREGLRKIRDAVAHINCRVRDR